MGRILLTLGEINTVFNPSEHLCYFDYMERLMIVEALKDVAKAQLKKMVSELSDNGWVLARKKNVNDAWILEVVGWETLDWQSLLKEID